MQFSKFTSEMQTAWQLYYLNYSFNHNNVPDSVDLYLRKSADIEQLTICIKAKCVEKMQSLESTFASENPAA